VVVRVDGFTFLADFVVVNFEPDPRVPNLDHQDDSSIPRPPPEPPDVEKCFEPKAGILIIKEFKGVSKSHDFLTGILPTLPTLVLDLSFISSFVSFESKDTIFYPGIVTFLEPVAFSMAVSYSKYGYIKNHKKTVKNGQARTRESEEYKKEAKDSKPKPEKQTLVGHIPPSSSRVPVKLDFEDWNFGSWVFFFKQLFSSYDVTKFIHDDSTSSTSIPLTPEEIKVDKIVLSWIFTTLSDPLQKQLVVAHPSSAKAAWKILTDIVKDNKRSCTFTLKTEFLDCIINDEDVVHSALEGLSEKYNQVCGYMHYQTIFLDLKTARTLLIIEEMRLKSKEVALPVDSSSPMVLMAQASSCRFRSECRYVHDPNAKPHDFGNSKTTAGPTGSVPTGHATLLLQAFTVGTLHDPNTDAWNMDTGASSHLNSLINSLSMVFNSCLYPSISVGDGHSIPVTNTGHIILPTLTRPLHLNNVLITPHIVKNLISVRQFV
ncbi:hypothetical protein Tco_1418188, partial [Tanacetum coccineum]